MLWVNLHRQVISFNVQLLIFVLNIRSLILLMNNTSNFLDTSLFCPTISDPVPKQVRSSCSFDISLTVTKQINYAKEN